MNIHAQPENGINPANLSTAVFCDGPNGPASRILIWPSKEKMNSGAPAAFALDFDGPADVLRFFGVNLEMVRTICGHLAKQAAADREKLN